MKERQNKPKVFQNLVMRRAQICKKEAGLGENNEFYFRDTIIQQQMLPSMEIVDWSLANPFFTDPTLDGRSTSNFLSIKCYRYTR